MQSMAERLQGSKGLLAGLIAQSRQLARLNRIFHAYLPPHLQPHARLVGVDPKQWTVQADGPAWATRLRYVLPSLRGQLAQQLGCEVPPLKVRVVPPAEPPPPPRRQLTVSAAAAQVIEGAAKSIQDPALSAALARLARHAREQRTE
ncbi:MAG TPA: DUF721 domain-containing protein [Candidatus Competibacteraceae bacterium]|nr:DUF721 domain-containing protein [Candidatus Competibacteraceae bacterium]